MKNKKSKAEPKHLSDLVALVNDANRRAAMEEYLGGDDHDHFYLAIALTKPCEKATEELRKGHLKPNPELAPDAATFVGILTSPTSISYDGCAITEPDEDDPLEADEEIPAARYECLAKLPPEELLEMLTDASEDNEENHVYLCSPVLYTQRHESDAKAQRDYYVAVLDRFSAAAEYAMKLGATETARKWLEAQRLLMPGSAFSRRDIRDWRGLCLVPENVRRAYAVAEEAHAMLWVDVRYRERSAFLAAAKKRQAKSKARR